MTPEILGILGGLGLFLLGMAVMTEGLKDLAGEALRSVLSKFTKSPLTGAATGAASTAVIQSSSATTVMAVGFVGAGLLTFPQALGIIFGANIGTTMTGWLVALLGFKLSLKELVLPLIFVGALMRLFGRRRVAATGYALSGFGLVFAGIAMLQTGMETFRDVVTPESFPSDTLFGRLLLVFIGIAITLATQSSSAGVATAITAVHVGNISLSQAAAMVIGMDVGTTVTAAIAAVGGNVNARRTALAHVIYNLMTGIVAFLMLPIYVRCWESFAPATARSDPEIALVAFHTLFNSVGVTAVLPFTSQFAALIVRLVPARESELTRRLEPSLLNQPHVAIESALATLGVLADASFSALAAMIDSAANTKQALNRLDEAEQAAAETRRYLNQINTTAADQHLLKKHVTAVHVLDHVARLIVRCRKEDRLTAVRADKELLAISSELAQAVCCDITSSAQAEIPASQLERLWHELDERIEPYRRETIEQTAAGEASTDLAIERLDAIRWLRRVCYHAWRIVNHLAYVELDIEEETLEIDDDLD